MTRWTPTLQRSRKLPWLLRSFLVVWMLPQIGLFATQFFKIESTWYTKIPQNPVIMNGSANYVAEVQSVSPQIAISYKEWSVPVYSADASTPKYNMTITSTSTSVLNAISSNGWALNVPIPAGAKSAGTGLSGYYDRHMVVVRNDLGRVWDFFGMESETVGSTNRTNRVKVYDLNGDGIDQPYTGASCRVAPVPLLHGLITYEEITNGYIDHALAFATYNIKSGSTGVYPGVTSNSGSSTDPYAPWLGFRFQLDPTLDVNAMGLSRAGRIVAKALQEYGMILVERNGPGYNSVYAQDLDYSSTSWGTTFSGLGTIPISRMRVVMPIYPPPKNVRIVQ